MIEKIIPLLQNELIQYVISCAVSFGVGILISYFYVKNKKSNNISSYMDNYDTLMSKSQEKDKFKKYKVDDKPSFFIDHGEEYKPPKEDGYKSKIIFP